MDGGASPADGPVGVQQLTSSLTAGSNLYWLVHGLYWLVYGVTASGLAYGLWHVAWVLYRKCFWNLPPSYGVCLPLLGHLPHFLGVEDLPKAFADRCKALKSRLVYVRLAGFDAIVICDYKLAVEAFVSRDKEFSGRPHLAVLETVLVGSPLTRDATAVWKVQRKLLHESIRLYASGRLLEEHSYEAAEKTLAAVRSEKGPFEPRLHLYSLVYDLLTMVCFNKCFSLEEAEFRQLVHLNQAIISALNGGVLGDFLALFRSFPFNFLDVNQRKLKKVGAEHHDLIRKMFDERRSQFDRANPSCLVDHILNYYEKLKRSNGDDEERTALKDMKLADLIGLCFVTYAGGGESTSNTLICLIYLMALYPDVQRKLRSHLMDVVGSGRPRLSDKGRLSYLRAVLREVMRVGTVFPLGGPHRSLSETTLAGYDIPANTMVVCNQWALHHDPSYWGHDVGSFRPERFLNDDGTLAPTPDSLMPFGCGRRVCPGESLVLQELLLLVPPLFQRLEFRFPKDYAPPRMECLGTGLLGLNMPSFQVEVREV